MKISRVKRIILVCWLAGVVVLCVWTPHRLARAYYGVAPVHYAWTWAAPQWGSSPGYSWPYLDTYRVMLSLAAWTALLGAIFLFAPDSVPATWLEFGTRILHKAPASVKHLGNQQVATSELHLHPELTPKSDETFIRLAQKAVKGILPVYFAAIPIALCVPFDLDYRPDKHAAGKQAIEATAQEWAAGKSSRMVVYQRGAWFVVADDYIPFFAALRGNPPYVPCWVLGKPDTEYAKDVQGPIEVKEVPKILGLG